jgi:hypothetical protein
MIDVHRSSCKVPVLLLDFNETYIFWIGFRKTFKCQISRQSVQWEPSCSMWTDRRADRHDVANSRFSQFRERT